MSERVWLKEGVFIFFYRRCVTTMNLKSGSAIISLVLPTQDHYDVLGSIFYFFSFAFYNILPNVNKEDNVT